MKGHFEFVFDNGSIKSNANLQEVKFADMCTMVDFFLDALKLEGIERACVLMAVMRATAAGGTSNEG